MSNIRAIVEKLSIAPGVIFDVRNYPKGNASVLSYLVTQPIEFAQGMKIPHIIRPDHRADAVLTWSTSNDMIDAREPHILGRVAFLTGANAISYAESIMSLVEFHHLGAIVGGATAGTNGNIAEIATPTGCRTRFTGLRADKPDGSQFHLIGVQPTIPVVRTLAGVKASRDEVFERALQYVREGR